MRIEAAVEAHEGGYQLYVVLVIDLLIHLIPGHPNQTAQVIKEGLSKQIKDHGAGSKMAGVKEAFNKNVSKGIEILEISNINSRIFLAVRVLQTLFEGKKTAFTNGILLAHSCD